MSHFHQARIHTFARVTSSFEPPNQTPIRFTNHFTFSVSHPNSLWLSQREALSNLPTKIPSGSPSWGPVEIFWPAIHLDLPPGIHHELSNQNTSHIAQLGYIPYFYGNYPRFVLISHPFTDQVKFFHMTPAPHNFHFYTHRTPLHTLNLPPILLSYQKYLHLPHPNSI